jgi:putative flippase GtrA
LSRAGGAADRPARSPRFPEIYQRFRQQIHEGAKFGIVGLTGVVVVIAGNDFLHFGLGVEKYISLTLATIAATIITFLGNRYWSFRHREGGSARNDTILFFVLNAVGLLIQWVCLWIVTDAIGLSDRFWYSAATLFGIGLGTLFRFWSYRKWIWVSPEAALARLRRGRHRKGRAPYEPPTVGSPVPPVPPVTVRPEPGSLPRRESTARSEPQAQSSPAA